MIARLIPGVSPDPAVTRSGFAFISVHSRSFSVQASREDSPFSPHRIPAVAPSPECATTPSVQVNRTPDLKSPICNPFVYRYTDNRGSLWTAADVPVIGPGMASIIRRPESKYFIACWTDAEGRRLKRSTKTTESKLAASWPASSRKRAARSERRSRPGKILADIYKDISGEELPTVTVRDFFDGFVDRKRPEIGRATLDYYAGHARRFLDWLGEKADRDIAAITSTEIIAYRNHVAKRVGPRTMNNGLKAVRAFFAAAKNTAI